MDNQLRFHDHVWDMVRKAAGLASNLLRSIVNQNSEFMVTLFITHVRPILDYCSCFLNVGYLGDLNLLESVQRRWTKQVAGLFNLSYAERLRALNLFSVRGTLLRANLIKYWKILSCETSANDLSVLFQRCRDERTRGHRFRFVMPFCNRC